LLLRPRSICVAPYKEHPCRDSPCRLLTSELIDSLGNFLQFLPRWCGPIWHFVGARSIYCKYQPQVHAIL
jgi:hypothetical protein